MRLHLLRLGSKICLKCQFVVLKENYTYADDDWNQSELNCSKVEPDKRIKE